MRKIYLFVVSITFLVHSYAYEEIESISFGAQHAMAKVDGEFYVWGDFMHRLARKPKNLDQANILSAGAFHNCAGYFDGRVSCWRSLFPADRPPVTNVPEDVSFVDQLISGINYNCARMGKRLRCWGINQEGELNVPEILDNNTLMISGSYPGACGVAAADGSVHCWGFAQVKAQFGADFLAPPEDLLFPRQIEFGGTSFCALTQEDSIVCWGVEQQTGELTIPENLPAIKQISGETGGHYCALDFLGQVYCWGGAKDYPDKEYYGQADVPEDLGEVKQIFVNGSTSCAQTVDHQIRCWGADSDYKHEVNAWPFVE